MAPRYREVNSYADLTSEFQALNTLWFVVLGDGNWRDSVISKAKEQVTDKPQFEVLWLKDPGILKASQKAYFTDGKSEIVAFSLAENLGVGRRLASADAQLGGMIGDALDDAETYEGNGYCLAHGECSGPSCTQPGAHV